MNMQSIRMMSNRYGRLLKLVLLAVALLFAVWWVTKWTVMRVYVPHNKALLVINKFGDPLPPDRTVVPLGEEGRYKGVREEVLGPGRYFFNPFFYDTEEVDLQVIPAGDPAKWDWTPDGDLKDSATAPMVGLVTLQEGATPEDGQEVVDAGYKGVQREVLTPGTYKINPKQKRVELKPAVVVPPGSVGVVTRLTGERGAPIEVESAPITVSPEPAAEEEEAADEVAAAEGAAEGEGAAEAVAGAGEAEEAEEVVVPPPSRLVVGPNQRGVLKDVLQPGVYYLNPRLVKVSIMPVGYDQITLEAPQNAVRFFSSDGYQVEADLTVVWGRKPSDAPSIVANIGTTDDVRVKVIEQAVRAACQNEGTKFSAQALIQGDTRSEFQDALSNSLKRQVEPRNLQILLALIRNIKIQDTRSGGGGAGGDSDGLLATIQKANIEIERNLTNRQKTETAKVQGAYEEALKLVDLAEEEVLSETKREVAKVMATGKKKAAEIDADRELTVAGIGEEIATLEADRTRILGQAKAQVEQLKNDAEAQGMKMMVDAFGSPQAYNQYIFAKTFEPQELRLIFAGPGTFWTDLKSFEQVGASRMLQASQEEAAEEEAAAEEPEPVATPRRGKARAGG